MPDKSTRNILYAIDPGTRSTGFAIWVNPDSSGDIRPYYVGLFQAKDKTSTWFARVDQMGQAFKQQLQLMRPNTVVIELPEYYGHDPATATQAILKLAVLVGHFTAMATEYGAKCVELVPVSDWKGQMSKQLVIRRIRKILNPDDCSEYQDDIWDAVGIGLHYLGKVI